MRIVNGRRAPPAREGMKALDEYTPGVQAIIRTAEKLYGEQGLNGPSLRQIISDAGQGNRSAVHHHFRDKEGLILAIFQCRERVMEVERAARLTALDTRGDQSLDGLLDAWLMPIIDCFEEDDRLANARFQLQLLPLSDADHPYFRTMRFAPASVSLTQRIAAHLAPLPAKVINMRLLLASSLFLEGVRNERRVLAQDEESYGSADLFRAELLQMVRATLDVPFPPRPEEHLPSRS